MLRQPTRLPSLDQLHAAAVADRNRRDRERDSAEADTLGLDPKRILAGLRLPEPGEVRSLAATLAQIRAEVA